MGEGKNQGQQKKTRTECQQAHTDSEREGQVIMYSLEAIQVSQRQEASNVSKAPLCH